MKFLFAAILLVSLTGVSCERHEFDETRRLHEHHGADHGDAGHGDEHGGAHKEKDHH